MNQKLTSPVLWVAILSAIKLVLEAAGISLLDNQKVDAIANGIAAAIAVVGIIVDHGNRKAVAPVQPVVVAPVVEVPPVIQ